MTCTCGCRLTVVPVVVAADSPIAWTVWFVLYASPSAVFPLPAAWWSSAVGTGCCRFVFFQWVPACTGLCSLVWVCGSECSAAWVHLLLPVDCGCWCRFHITVGDTFGFPSWWIGSLWVLPAWWIVLVRLLRSVFPRVWVSTPTLCAWEVVCPFRSVPCECHCCWSWFVLFGSQVGLVETV